MYAKLPSIARSTRFSRRHLIAATAAATAAAHIHGPWAALARPSAANQAASDELWPDAGSIPATLPADPSPQFSAVADALMEAMAQNGVPGTALGILMDGREEHAVFGMADVDNRIEVTPETRFQIGSVGKTYTATAIMQLVAAGKIDLYAPVRTYLPDLRLEDESVAARVTIHHLMTHTAGWWGDTFFDTGDGDDAIARLVEERLPTLPQYAPLGMFASYNNGATILLGRVLEVVEGKRYRDVIQNLQLDPLGMSYSTYDVAEADSRPHSLGYHSGPQGTELQTPLHLPRSLEPAGGNFWSTTPEQLLFARLHLSDGVTPDGVRLLPAYTTQLMRTPQSFFGGVTALQMGLIWFVQEIGGIRFATHIGDTFGQHTTLVIAPDKGFALVLLTNAEPGGGAAAGAALTAAARAYLGMDEDAARVGVGAGVSFASDTTPLELSSAELEEYAGRFETPIDAMSLRVDGDQLLISVETKEMAGYVREDILPEEVTDYPISVIGGDRLAIGSNMVASFIRRPNGEIGWIRASVRTMPRVDAG
jgi:CubicO group peptidase (beta-lactamase class C family)